MGRVKAITDRQYSGLAPRTSIRLQIRFEREVVESPQPPSTRYFLRVVTVFVVVVVFVLTSTTVVPNEPVIACLCGLLGSTIS